jgi:hypothetical protein
VIERVVCMDFRRLLFELVLGLWLCGAGLAQAPIEPVQWTGSAILKTPVKQGSRIEIDLSAEVEEGWHVYGLTQAPGGPTPLRVTLDENRVVQLVGVKSGTAPVKKHAQASTLKPSSILGRSPSTYRHK